MEHSLQGKEKGWLYLIKWFASSWELNTNAHVLYGHKELLNYAVYPVIH